MTPHARLIRTRIHGGIHETASPADVHWINVYAEN